MVRLTTDTRPHLVTVMWTGAPGGGRAPRSLTLRLVLEFSHPPPTLTAFSMRISQVLPTLRLSFVWTTRSALSNWLSEPSHRHNFGFFGVRFLFLSLFL